MRCLRSRSFELVCRRERTIIPAVVSEHCFPRRRNWQAIKKAALVVAFLELLAPFSPAPIFGRFPGLEKLVADSEAIVVARIERRSAFLPPMIYGEYEIVLEKVLKGDLSPGSRMKVWLRDLSYPERTSFDPFTYRSRHILFLRRGEASGYPSEWRSLNCEGAHLPFSKHLQIIATFGSAPETPSPDPLVEELKPYLGSYPPRETFSLGPVAFGLCGAIVALLLKIFLLRKLRFRLYLIRFLIAGFVAGVLAVTATLTLYARDISVLADGWECLGIVLLLVILAGAYLTVLVGVPVWLAHRLFRSRMMAHVRWRVAKQIILTAVLILFFDATKSYLAVRLEQGPDAQFQGIYFDGVWNVMFISRDPGGNRLWLYTVPPLLPFVESRM
jgi:hypothetical protein